MALKRKLYNSDDIFIEPRTERAGWIFAAVCVVFAVLFLIVVKL